MCQQMVQTAIFFTLFELFKSKFKPSSMREGAPPLLLPLVHTDMIRHDCEL